MWCQLFSKKTSIVDFRDGNFLKEFFNWNKSTYSAFKTAKKGIRFEFSYITDQATDYASLLPRKIQTIWNNTDFPSELLYQEGTALSFCVHLELGAHFRAAKAI